MLPWYYITTAQTRFPVTLDILLTIALTELNRYVIEGRRIRFLRQRLFNDSQQSPEEKRDREDLYLESQRTTPSLDCLAAVVGWREDPTLYRRALESYKASTTCVFLLAGIDGDEAQDQEMVDVFNRVGVALRTRLSTVG